ncbi:MAG: hypothetical protein HW416_111, partial [Chloroflexi bacterium]|nr:hypothetical protein [Chloroflexota bacterium]
MDGGPLSYRSRIVRAVALAAVPLMAFAAVVLWRDARAEESRTADDRIALARAAALLTEAFIDGQVSTVQTLAVTSAITDPTLLPDLPTHMQRLAAENPEWEGVGLLGPDGVAVGGSAVAPRP